LVSGEGDSATQVSPHFNETSLRLPPAGAFSTIYYETSLAQGLIKITAVIKQNFPNNISTEFKLYWLHNSRYNQLKINFQAMILPTGQLYSGLHEYASWQLLFMGSPGMFISAHIKKIPYLSLSFFFF
jgi:hypothetical protein